MAKVSRADERYVRGQFPVIAVGASAGGLEAFTKFLQRFPPDSGMAIIFVQHLDPSHESMMGSLLSPHTKMAVREAKLGLRLERNCVYLIAPGTYLAVRDGGLVVSKPEDRHGARMPFDYLLRSLAESHGEQAIGVVLSGNGTDGSLGLRAISDAGGLVVAQDPDEAAHAGMPQSAIRMSAVDLILPVEKIPASLAAYTYQVRAQRARVRAAPEDPEPELAQVTELLRSTTGHDFTYYKPGTLMRRIKRRLAIHALGDVTAYLALLLDDAKEREVLAKDLLIHVTGFFRDAEAFKLLAAEVAPALVRQLPPGQPLRVWVPACSSGEEVYSIAMIFLEAIAATKRSVKLQVFGSDIDEQAIAIARAGQYPRSLKGEISPERLQRFFLEDGDGYRVATCLREIVIFTVQDILSDPPFARLDFVSCRNLLIYLLPEAQLRVLSLLHFALRKDGVLMLGIAESTGELRGDFEPISDSLRLFRRAGGTRKLKPEIRDQKRLYWPRPLTAPQPPETHPREIAQRLLWDAYTPASVLINQKHEGLHFFGATDNYLQVPAGDASRDLLAMVRQGLRNKLRSAIQRARAERGLVAISGGTVERSGAPVPVRVEVRPVEGADKEYFLVSFVDEPVRARGSAARVSKASSSTTAELEKTVALLEQELENNARQLEISTADQETINEEAQSLNEEYQSTNEELETSKEELQSLNEELTALNGQLTATISQQRSTADDLQNMLRSSGLAIVFLDLDLNIRFFSAAAKALLNTIDADVGRPIGDLAYRFNDGGLVADAGVVLKSGNMLSREIEAHGGEWYTRQIFPYRTQAGAIQGVVLTFANISVMKSAEQTITAARAYADRVIDTVHQPLVVVDERLQVVSGNSAFCRLFGIKQDQVVGRDLTALGGGRLDLPAMNSFLDRARAESAPIEEYELEINLASLGSRVLLLSSRRITGVPAIRHHILIAMDDITERKHLTETLEVAKLKAETANLGKSRFLAAASHDLRQPLQTLTLLHGVLAERVTDPESLSLIGNLEETLGAMSGMLDTLLDINQLEAGTVQPEIDSFAIGPLLEALRTEFTYVAKAKGIALHAVPCGLRVRSDPLLLSQMIRNLLSNAVKYTKRGKILLGCRRRRGKVRIEVWDTGIGIPSGQLKAIFEEYHQLGNPARERGLGLGLGLSIVQRVGALLGHRIDVRSQTGQGSVFTVEVPIGDDAKVAKTKAKKANGSSPETLPAAGAKSGSLLVVEDDPTVRNALELLFNGHGYHTITATDGVEVAALVQRGALMPDAVIADYNLPAGRTGLEVIRYLRQTLGREIPAIVLTGDIAADVLRRVVAADCGFLHKPVNVRQLLGRVHDLIASSKESEPQPARTKKIRRSPDQSPATVFVVDDDEVLLASMRDMLESRGQPVEVHPSAESFLAAYSPGRTGCLVVDSVMPGMNGLELLQRLKTEGRALPSIVITGYGDITMAIKAMKVGAMDFIEKPARQEGLLASVARAMAQTRDTHRSGAQVEASASIAALSPRERDVMNLVVQGLPNKEIAATLKISRRTVESHRAEVMKRTGSASLPDLIRLVMRAS